MQEKRTAQKWWTERSVTHVVILGRQLTVKNRRMCRLDAFDQVEELPSDACDGTTDFPRNATRDDDRDSGLEHQLAIRSPIRIRDVA